MPNNSDYQLNSLLISRFRPGVEDRVKDVDGLMFHYTSPSGLLSILENNEVFFTDIRFLNDKSEDIYLVKLILDILDKNKHKYPYVSEVVNKLFKNHKISDLRNLKIINIDYYTPLKFIPRRKFVFCTTTDADLLNMWNYYVHDGRYQGYNIGFNVEKLLKSLDSKKPKTIDPFSVIYGKVLYDSKKQKKEIFDLFNRMENSIKTASDKSKEIDFYVMNLRSYIDSYGAFYKNPSFSQEKEFRFCIEIDDERLKQEKPHYSSTVNTRMRCAYRVANGLIVPYISVKFNKDAVSTIHMSPMTEFQIAKESIREVLNDYHYNSVQVRKSTIPIRF